MNVDRVRVAMGRITAVNGLFRYSLRDR